MTTHAKDPASPEVIAIVRLIVDKLMPGLRTAARLETQRAAEVAVSEEIRRQQAGMFHPRAMTEDEYAAMYSAAIAVEKLPADERPPYLAPLLRATAERLYVRGSHPAVPSRPAAHARRPLPDP
jgi:hypothetical protein